jgi:uncharacterized low-complexity protein
VRINARLASTNRTLLFLEEAGEKAPEGKAPEGKATEGKATEGKAVEGKTGAPEGKATEGKATEGKAVESKATEGKATEGKGAGKTGKGADKTVTVGSCYFRWKAVSVEGGGRSFADDNRDCFEKLPFFNDVTAASAAQFNLMFARYEERDSGGGGGQKDTKERVRRKGWRRPMFSYV